MRATLILNRIPALFLLLPALGFPQAQQKASLTVKGYPGRAPVIQVNGKSYVEIESLARLTNSSISFQANQITLTLPAPVAPPAPVATPAPAQADQPARLSRDFLRAGIEEMAVIGEWRTAIANAIQNNYPVTEDSADSYRRNAASKLELAATTVVTEPDRSVLLLFRNEFEKMRGLSDKYLAMRKSLTYISPDSLDNDPLNQQIQACARGLAALTSSDQLPDVAACH